MAKINIEYSSQLSAQETYNRLKPLIGDNNDLRQLDQNYSCEFDDLKFLASASGKQFDAKLSISEAGSNSNISLDLKIGLVLSPFKSVIEEKLVKKLEKILS